MVKKIGILTSGGDCAGLNAVIRAVTLRACNEYGWKVYGLRDGTLGLMKDPVDVVELKPEKFDGNLMRMGGTFLGSNNKGNPFGTINENGKKIEVSELIISSFKKLELDALIGIGGDGSLKLLQNLTKKGNINFIGIPKTIDNDVKHNELSIGYDTAVDVATNALDMLQPTAASHRRAMILEVMGRDAGHIAINAGIAGGADIILIPELNYTIKGVVDKLTEMKNRGIVHSLIVVAEAVKTENGETYQVEFADGQKRLGGIGTYLSEEIMKKTEIECRVTSLGHVQRGAPPTPRDRILASAFGVYAVDLLAQGRFDRMVAWQDRKVVDVPISEGISTYKIVDRSDPLIETALALGVYVGDIK